ncbi:dipeptidyl peptidase IV N-terminal region-domain-containing protein [Scheffersomyces amazonensis]|uniref:dipeptidyl peptidase IV N-terminal region-domain-containing protein n=1 Tax=Scheffersomyces amazonensis TaxID=1078765 RepID=UPI00315CBA6C
MFKSIFGNRLSSNEGSTSDYEMVYQSPEDLERQIPVPLDRVTGLGSGSGSGSISTPSPRNESDIDIDNDNDNDNDTFHDSNRSRSSTDSQSSEIFQDIQSYSAKHDEEVDDFSNNPVFQTVLSKYKGSDVFGKRILIGISSIILLLWVIGLIIYSNQSVHQIINSFKWQTNVQVSGQNITLNQYDPTFSNVTMLNYQHGKYFAFKSEINWLKQSQYHKNHPGGGYFLTREGKQSFVIKQINSKFSEQLIDDDQFTYRNDFFHIEDLILNPAHSVEDWTNNYHMVVSDKVTQWRHSSFALYWLVEPITGEFIPIQPPVNEKELNNPNNNLKPELLDKLHFAEFSPKGDHIVYGFDHDLFIIDLKTLQTNRITNTGSPDIFNGKSDWIYEEEVVATDKLFWWSPDQENLIFASINDTNVPNYELDYYVKDRTEVGTQYKESDEVKVEDVNQYPIKTNIKYPKPGHSNPIVTLYNYKLNDESLIKIVNNYDNVGNEFILYDAIWIDNNNFLMKQTDRTSTILTKKLYQPSKSNTVYEINSMNVTQEYGGWVEKVSPLLIIPNKDTNINSYIDKIVIGGRTTLALFDTASSKTYSKLLLDNPDWDVTASSPIIFDSQQNYIYFLSTIRSSMDSHLMAIDISTDDAKLIPITSPEQDGNYYVNFSEDGQYLDLYYKGPLQPWQRLINMAEIHDYLNEDESRLSHGADEIIQKSPIINHYEVTKDNLKQVNLPTQVFKTVQIDKNADGSPINLNVIEILPPNFNPDKGFKYPLLVHAYGGPGSQTVQKSFDIDFQHVVSATLNSIVLIVDPRGTGGQGWKFANFAKDKIGYWEPRDLTTYISEYISKNKKFIDKQRVGIWGWSYGGFTTLKTLEYDSGTTFKYGMAVAPVTNWLFYDSIYTERYMNEPQNNENYNKYSKIINFDNFKSINRFLIMHGSADDNVHIQNSMWLLDNFNMNSIENYDFHIFPDSDHGIYYHNAQSIIYDKLLHWLTNAFTGQFDNFI